MLIQWLGHSSFLVVSSGGTKIITDPYEPGGSDGRITHRPITVSPDIVTVSHQHADHSYVEGLNGDFQVAAKAGSSTVRGIPIKGIETCHDSDYGSVRGKNVVMMMSVDRMRVCHLGDLGHELSPNDLENIGQVDILMVPVGGYYTIGPAEATRVVDRIRPKLVMPMHYKTDKVDFPIQPVDAFLQGKTNVRRINSSEYEITREQLPDQTEIVVLKSAL